MSQHFSTKWVIVALNLCLLSQMALSEEVATFDSEEDFDLSLKSSRKSKRKYRRSHTVLTFGEFMIVVLVLAFLYGCWVLYNKYQDAANRRWAAQVREENAAKHSSPLVESTPKEPEDPEAKFMKNQTTQGTTDNNDGEYTRA